MLPVLKKREKKGNKVKIGPQINGRVGAEPFNSMETNKNVK